MQPLVMGVIIAMLNLGSLVGKVTTPVSDGTDVDATLRRSSPTARRLDVLPPTIMPRLIAEQGGIRYVRVAR